MATSSPGEADAGDPALAALDRLLDALEDVERDFAAIRLRAAHIKQQRAAGVEYRALVPAENRPLAVQLLSSVQEKLAVAGSDWRREEALALHREGVSMEAIGELFGVSRQRVSALLAGRAD